MKTSRIRIEGMTCRGCTARVSRILTATPGVSEVSVDLASGVAIVRHASEVSAAGLVAGLAREGYGSCEMTSETRGAP
jgi:Cu+-exporting ATPase